MILNPLFDYIINTEKGTLLIYSPNYYSWNIIATIVSRWDKYNIIIVTTHPNEFTTTILPDKWIDRELVPFTLISYDEINKYINNSEVDIFIFDKIPNINLNNINNKVIILTTWGDDYNNISLSGLKLLSFNLPFETKIVSITNDPYNNLLDNIIANYPQKQFILTSNTDEIKYLTYLQIANGQNPYNPDDLIITNTIMNDSETKYDIIHIFNNYPLINIVQLMQSNYPKIIYIYDSELIKNVVDADKLYSELMSVGNPIVYNNGLKVIVK